MLAYRKRGARLLPILGYNAPWSWDKSAREYSHGNTRRTIRPRDDGKFDLTVFERVSPVAAWRETKREIVEGNERWPLDSGKVRDWENYVRRVVTFLRRAPYHVEYFQVWNEAHPNSGFWDGDLDSYMTRVHLPATRIIRSLGGKVVYGGWISTAPVAEYIALLDQHRAWQSLDVLDVPYHGLASWEALSRAASTRGFPKLAIWQTEIGFTPDPGWVSNFYPRFLHWSLRHDWRAADRYKLFFYAQWSPEDAQAYGYGHTLFSGANLSPHGRSLRVLAQLLNGDLRASSAVESKPPLAPQLDENRSSLEAFQVGGTKNRRLVVALHLEKEVATPNVTLRLPHLSRAKIAAVQRIDAAGNALDLRNELRDSAGGATLSIPVRNDAGSDAFAWNEKTAAPRTFYVEFVLR